MLKNKVVIVTGASSGIGLACAREYARRGAMVVMAARSIDKLERYKNELLEKGLIAIAVQTDVTQESDCKNLIETTVREFGKIDILINNAGISMRALCINAEFRVIKKVMDVNFWGTVYCTRFALPYLIKSKGDLVAISSVAGFHGLPGRCAYSASKFAITGFLESIRVENLKNGLHVMIVSAGFTSTNIRKVALNAKGDIQGESPRDESKMMSPERVARQVIWGLKVKKRHRILTAQGQLVALFQRIVPKLVDSLAYRTFAKEPDSPLN